MGDAHDIIMYVRLTILLCVLCSLVVGCSKSGDNVGPTPDEVDLIGTYTIRHSSVVGKKEDSVYVSINNTSYTTTHFGPGPKFCDAQGTIVNYRQSGVELVPDQVFIGGCDSLHIPRGNFDATYSGDTVILERRYAVMTPSPGDSVFTLFLLKAK